MSKAFQLETDTQSSTLAQDMDSESLSIAMAENPEKTTIGSKITDFKEVPVVSNADGVSQNCDIPDNHTTTTSTDVNAFTNADTKADEVKSLVAVQEYRVASWEPWLRPFYKRRDAHIWMVRTQAKRERGRGRGMRIWTNEPEAQAELCNLLGCPVPDITQANGSGGFKKGQALRRNKTVKLQTCGGKYRPRVVYRVVHDGMPYGGIMARGHDTAVVDPLMFQIFAQKHMDWRCRWPSPFLSVATTMARALEVCASYWRAGRRGIKIHEIDTHSKDWDHDKQRMFDLGYLVKALGLPKHGNWFKATRYYDECLVEHSIPEGSIIRTMEWDEIRSRHGKEVDKNIMAQQKQAEYYREMNDRDDGGKQWRKRQREMEKLEEAKYGKRTKGFKPLPMGE